MIHIITGEYPPMVGGVAGYTEQLANALVELGRPVHVWTAGTAGDSDENGISVHRVAGSFHPGDLVRLRARMNSIPGPRRVLIQWTPHSFGMRGLNLAFPFWLWNWSVRQPQRIEVIVHEAFIAFGEKSWRRDFAAAIQRVMAVALLQSAGKIWVTIPKWEERLRAWTIGKNIAFEWLPVPSNVPAVTNISAIAKLRRRLTQSGYPLIGHFGTFRQDTESLLVPALLRLVECPCAFLFIGRGSEEARARLVASHPDLSRRVFATGELDPDAIVVNVAACDVLLQPYPDGISTRRGSAMAALSLGVPIVTNLGPLSEQFWSNSGAAAFAGSYSAADLSVTTLQLLEDHARRSRISAEARDLYQDRFHIRHTVAALLRDDVTKTSRAHAA